MRRARVWSTLVAALSVAPSLAGAGPQTAPPDSSAPDTTTVLRVRDAAPAAGMFDTVRQRRFLSRHAFSLDHYMESEPAYVLGRRGPIGNDVRLSRFGIGRGRALLYLDGVAVNDPQNGVAPIVHFPTSDLGMLSFGPAASARSGAQNIEGSIWMDPQPFPDERPSTFVELSKGTNDLRQRRVRFSSVESAVGVDFAYDELLNDGYAFRINEGPLFRFGETRSRHVMTRLRGRTEGGARFAFSLRRYTATANGEVTSGPNEARSNGHLAVLSGDIGRLDVSLYTRGSETNAPDSSTTHQTSGARVGFALLRSGGGRAGVTVGFEDIMSAQRVRGGTAYPRLRRGTAGVTAGAALPLGFNVRARFTAEDYDETRAEWGGGVVLARPPDPVGGVVFARRGFRMPNMGELYLPAHGSGTVVRGDASVEPEHAWEVGAAVTTVVGPLTNEVRATGLRAVDPIAFTLSPAGNVNLLSPGNGSSEELAVLEERLRVDASLRGVRLILDAGVVLTDGDRDRYFMAVPESRAAGALKVGGSLFEATSSLYAGVEVIHTSERRTYSGGRVDPYRVINLTLEGRLLDANMYLAWLNITDEIYETENGFAMTPRTFVYGINWELFR